MGQPNAFMATGRILAVDDDRFFREYYTDVLTAEGYQVDTVADPATCLQRLAENAYDLVILDLVLENASGLELARQIRNENSGLEIMIATRVDDMVSINRALSLGIKEYVIKPIHEAELLQTVADVLERQRIFLEHGKLLAQSAEYFYTLSLYKRGLAILGTLELDALVDLMLDGFMQETEAAGAIVWLAAAEQTAQFREAGRRGLIDTDEPAEFGYSDYRSHDQLLRELPFFPHREGGGPGDLDRSCVHVPLIRDKELLGILKLVRNVEGQFRNRDLRTLRMLGEFSAIALQNALVVQDLKRRTARGENAVLPLERFLEIAERERVTAQRYSRSFSLVESNLPLSPEDADAFFKDFLRETDVVTHVGERRFRFFLPETDGVGARSFGRRLVTSLRSRGVAREELETVTHAAFPADGESLEELIATLTRRREAWDRSPGRVLEKDDFWSIFDRLVRSPDAADIDKNFFLDAVHFLYTDIRSDARKRSVLFLGFPELKRHGAWLEERILDLGKQARLTLFGDATDFTLDAAHEHCVAIHVPAFPGGERYFALYLTGESGFVVLFERGEGGVARGFVAADPFLADALIFALQEQYFLQRQL